MVTVSAPFVVTTTLLVSLPLVPGNTVVYSVHASQCSVSVTQGTVVVMVSVPVVVTTTLLVSLPLGPGHTVVYSVHTLQCSDLVITFCGGFEVLNVGTETVPEVLDLVTVAGVEDTFDLEVSATEEG